MNGRMRICFDTETTGLKKTDQVISIALVCVETGSEYHSLIRASVPTDPRAQTVHGITAAELVRAPTWKQVCDEVRDFLRALGSSYTLHAHNLAFDLRLLRQSAEAHGGPPMFSAQAVQTAVCTLCLARRSNKSTKASASTKLSAIYRSVVGTEMPDQHDALGDARALARILFLQETSVNGP